MSQQSKVIVSGLRIEEVGKKHRLLLNDQYSLIIITLN